MLPDDDGRKNDSSQKYPNSHQNLWALRISFRILCAMQHVNGTQLVSADNDGALPLLLGAHVLVPQQQQQRL